MKVITGCGNVLTVVRDYHETTAASHTSRSKVYKILPFFFHF